MNFSVRHHPDKMMGEEQDLAKKATIKITPEEKKKMLPFFKVCIN